MNGNNPMEQNKIEEMVKPWHDAEGGVYVPKEGYDEFVETLQTIDQQARSEEWQRCISLLDCDHSDCPVKETCVGYHSAQNDLMNQPPQSLNTQE